MSYAIEFWALLFADWRREYRRDLMDELNEGLSLWQFIALVSGLSPDCRFWQAVNDKPKKVSSPEAIAHVTGRYLGPSEQPSNN